MPSATGNGMASPDAAGGGLSQPMEVDNGAQSQPSTAAEEADAAGADVVAQPSLHMDDAPPAESSEQPDDAAQPALPNGIGEAAQPGSSCVADDEGGAAMEHATAADTDAADSAAAADGDQMHGGSSGSGGSGDAGQAGGSDSDDDDVPLGQRPAAAAANGGAAATASDAAAASDEDSDDRPLARFGSLNSGQSGPPSSPAAQPPKRQRTDGEWRGGDADSRAPAAEAKAPVRPGGSGSKERPGSGKSKTYTLPKIKRCALLTTSNYRLQMHASPLQLDHTPRQGVAAPCHSVLQRHRKQNPLVCPNACICGLQVGTLRALPHLRQPAAEAGVPHGASPPGG
jgi:hypothetical protein